MSGVVMVTASCLELQSSTVLSTGCLQLQGLNIELPSGNFRLHREQFGDCDGEVSELTAITII